MTPLWADKSVTSWSRCARCLWCGGALALRYGLRRRQRWRDVVTVGLTAGGLILAGAALSRHPWRSVGGYAGHSPWVQLLALVSLAVVTASVTMRAAQRPEEESRNQLQRR
ncbi:hypothetical protein [uncultured Mycobacterium sp.]|uniref:hypothetical protein n=1 Tax=uncultured Mycobacterium sp. TaxID=171292 RepID=UPI0035CA67CE